MPTATDGGAIAVGMEALNRLKRTAPPIYLTQSPELSKDARLASQYLFSSLNSYAPKSPFTHLLTDEFDAEQIWQQIDLQSVPLLSSLRRHVRNFEKNPQEIENLFSLEKRRGNKEDNVIENGEDEEIQGAESESESLDDEDEEEEENGDDDEGEMENMERENVNGVEDGFLKISELEEYLEEDEAREYGLKKKDSKRKRSKINDEDEDEDEDEDGDDEEEEEEEDEEEEELRFMGLGDVDEDDDEDGNKMENARYEDFFGGKRTGQKKKSAQIGGSLDLDMDYELNNGNKNQKKHGLSTHEKEQENLRSEIEKLEKANLEPKTWTMQGEVTAAKRPKNSALEVDLDFEHNVRPAPVITEEVTASLEELIQKRVLEARFDDVRKPPPLVQKAPREKIELDENKSKKGLAELYEDEYAQKTGLVSTALSFSDEQKKEASMLFKKLCLKLDALSHFHFTPKPVIEDMSIRENVPALAMEEIAPLAVSDAAMLAPEEVFSGKGDIKEETELTKTERKRRRANKKRRFKARTAKQMATKMQQSALVNHENGNEDK